MNKIRVEGVGYGSGFTQHATEFEFDTSLDFQNDFEEIKRRATWELKRKTACNSVKILSIKAIGVFYEADN